MVRKTLIREAFSAKHLPRDPKKIDDAYQHAKLREARYAEIEAQVEIEANANAILIDTAPQHPQLTSGTIDMETGEILDFEEGRGTERTGPGKKQPRLPLKQPKRSR
jgi:hypothetical protein